MTCSAQHSVSRQCGHVTPFIREFDWSPDRPLGPSCSPSVRPAAGCSRPVGGWPSCAGGRSGRMPPPERLFQCQSGVQRSADQPMTGVTYLHVEAERRAEWTDAPPPHLHSFYSLKIAGRKLGPNEFFSRFSSGR